MIHVMQLANLRKLGGNRYESARKSWRADLHGYPVVDTRVPGFPHPWLARLTMTPSLALAHAMLLYQVNL